MSLFRSGHNCLMNGHRFEARYDEGPNDTIEDIPSYSGSAGGLRKLMILTVYVRDICVRCGKTIERTDATAP